MKINLKSLFSKKKNGLIALSILSASVAICFSAHSSFEKVKKLNIAEIYQSVDFSPETNLSLSQGDIDFAMDVFAIDIPANVGKPTLNKEILDRGLTYGSGLGANKKVDVGPPAFTSWAILGSTLGHEVEVHCNQSFLFIWLSELFHMSGTVYAEREAYEYEIENSERFGLSIEEKNQIAYTKNFYYPLAVMSEKASRIDKLVATYLLSRKTK